MAHRKKLRLRDWLYGLGWEGNPIDRIFRVPWKHGSRHGWSVEDAALFQAWAKYTGKFNEGRDVPDPRKWKTNFRCALNALPDSKEIRGKSCPRGKNGYGLSWEGDPTERAFRVRVPLWKHGSRQGWSVEDAALSQAWASTLANIRRKRMSPTLESGRQIFGTLEILCLILRRYEQRTVTEERRRLKSSSIENHCSICLKPTNNLHKQC